MEPFRDDDYALAASVYSHKAKRHQLIDGDVGKKLEVFVIFTDFPGTVAAVQAAESLAQQLEANLRLVMPFEVSYTLPLTRPAVSIEFLEGQLRDLAAKINMEVQAEVCLCRDKIDALANLLPPNSRIVLGGKKRWWPTEGRRLMQTLQKIGHHAIYAELR